MSDSYPLGMRIEKSAQMRNKPSVRYCATKAFGLLNALKGKLKELDDVIISVQISMMDTDTEKSKAMYRAAKSTGNLADFAKKTASTFREFEEFSPFKADSLRGFKAVLTDLATLQKERGVSLGPESGLIGVGTA
ncbi:MAG: hypothetical protein IIA62_03510 [Nitrospinae bacterium]|nr:hypothetical protein [Nitrospinota bacterium]